MEAWPCRGHAALALSDGMRPEVTTAIGLGWFAMRNESIARTEL